MEIQNTTIELSNPSIAPTSKKVSFAQLLTNSKKVINDGGGAYRKCDIRKEGTFPFDVKAGLVVTYGDKQKFKVLGIASDGDRKVFVEAVLPQSVALLSEAEIKKLESGKTFQVSVELMTHKESGNEYYEATLVL